MTEKKVYCSKCRWYYFCRETSKIYCDSPKLILNKEEIISGTPIFPPVTKKIWHENHSKPEKQNENNNCKLYEKKKWWHTL